jgi:hypothetical protein
MFLIWRQQDLTQRLLLSTFKRIGLVTLTYVGDRFEALSRLHILHEQVRNSLRYRLNPGPGPGKV